MPLTMTVTPSSSLDSKPTPTLRELELPGSPHSTGSSAPSDIDLPVLSLSNHGDLSSALLTAQAQAAQLKAERDAEIAAHDRTKQQLEDIEEHGSEGRIRELMAEVRALKRDVLMANYKLKVERGTAGWDGVVSV